VASYTAISEKQLCQSPQFDVGAFQPCLPYELFDRNPIYLVRQSAKRLRVPVILLPAEIKALVNCLALRERTLVLLAASTGAAEQPFCVLNGLAGINVSLLERMAGTTRLELATSAVTGQRDSVL
jgi:hypothetical protein